MAAKEVEAPWCLETAPPLDTASLPGPGPATLLEPGVALRQVTFDRAGMPMTLWIYTPDPLPRSKLPGIVIAPAGAGLLNGVGLTEEDREEHLPYARSGYAVIAHSLDGGVQTDPTLVFRDGVAQFLAADLGLANTRAALDYASAQLPEVDMERIVAVGHSSAGAHALHVAMLEPRVKACVVYAPLVNLERSRWNLEEFADIDGVREAQFRIAPEHHVDRLRCPTFLFHAEDDLSAIAGDLASFGAALRHVNPRAGHEVVATGGHTDSMFEVGIPRALAWLAMQPELEPSD